MSATKRKVRPIIFLQGETMSVPGQATKLFKLDNQIRGV